jgi:hypothetical protein
MELFVRILDDAFPQRTIAWVVEDVGPESSRIVVVAPNVNIITTNNNHEIFFLI